MSSKSRALVSETNAVFPIVEAATMLITSMEISRTRTSQFPAVLHTASLALSSGQYLRWTSKNLQVRWADGKYGHPNFRKPTWLVKGSGYGSNCQKSYSADVAEYLKSQYISQNCSKKNNLSYRIQTSVPKFFCTQRQKSKATKHYKEDIVEKVYREHLPI